MQLVEALGGLVYIAVRISFAAQNAEVVAPIEDL
jgi:hypothetical protein